MDKVLTFLIISNIFFAATAIYLGIRANIFKVIKNKLNQLFFHSYGNSHCLKAPNQVYYNNHGYRWVKITCEAEFSPRDGAGILYYNDFLWLIGGWNPLNRKKFPLKCNNEVWRSEDGRNWTLIKKNTFVNNSFDKKVDWEGRHCAGYVVFKDKMWIIGGDANQGHYQNDVWNSKDGKNWDLVTDSVPWGPRALHYTITFQNKIWILGGQTVPHFAKAKERFYDDIWNSEDGLNWNKVDSKNEKWLARGSINGRAIHNEKIWVIGGGTHETPGQSIKKNFNDVWSSKDGINWYCHTQQAGWATRCFHSVAAWDQKLWILDGSCVNQVYGVGDTNEVWYSEDGENWTELPNTPWKPRHASSVIATHRGLYVIAGHHMEQDVWRLEKV